MSKKVKATSNDTDSLSVKALQSAGNVKFAQDLADIERKERAADQKQGGVKASLVERLIYGPAPCFEEMVPPDSNAHAEKKASAVLEKAMTCLKSGNAFSADGKLSAALRRSVANEQVYGLTVPKDYGGAGAEYRDLAVLEEQLAAHGFDGLAVEISGQLTIGAGGLNAYGSEEQKSIFLPMLAEGRLMGFALTEVKVGVNAKKVAAFADFDPENNCWRLTAKNDSSKLYITSATHGGLLAVVARLGVSSRELGLFVVELPKKNIELSEGKGYAFNCESSGVDAFQSNINSKVQFDNFPIPANQKVEADGLEVLFYSLGLGRCMLSAMCAGYQRRYAADAAEYARSRDGVGGRVISHELPQLAIGKMLGGALQSRSLSHLALQHNYDRISVAGLRDITKSVAARSTLESLLAAESVIGGRSLDKESRVNSSRSTVHAFNIVEGQNDLITLGMVRDVTGKFVSGNMAGVLGVMDKLNLNKDGSPVSSHERLLRITPSLLFKKPEKFFAGMWHLILAKDTWRLVAWTVSNALKDMASGFLDLFPASWRKRYRPWPNRLRRYAKYAERKLRREKWTFLFLNVFYQLELTRAQVPTLRFGQRVESLVSILAVLGGAARKSEDVQRIAALQAEMMIQRYRAIRILTDIGGMERTREYAREIVQDIESGECSMLDGLAPQAVAHPWGADQ